MNQQIAQTKRMITTLTSLILGSKTKINWGNQASIDANGINLPTPRVGDADEIALLTRLAVHEAGHVLHTDMGCLQRLTHDQLEYFNALEDARMERSLAARYPGARIILDHGIEVMNAHIETALQKDRMGLSEVLKKVDFLARAFVATGKTSWSYIAQALQTREAGEIYLPHQRQAIELAIEQLKLAQSSQECEAIAIELATKMQPQSAQQEDSGETQSQPQRQQEEEQSPSANGQGQSSDLGSTEPHAECDQNSPTACQEQSNEQAQEPQTADCEGAHEADEAGESQPEPDSPQEGPGDHASAADQDQTNGQAQAAEQNLGNDGLDGDAGNGSQPMQPTNGTGNNTESTENPDQSPQDKQDASGSGGDEQSSSETETDSGDAMDLGALLRMIHAEAYGQSPPETAQNGSEGEDGQADADSEDSQQQLTERVARALSDGDPNVQAEELIAKAVASIDDDAEPGQSLMQLAENAGGSGYTPGIPAESLSHKTSDQESRLSGLDSRLVQVLRKELADKRRNRRRLAHAGAKLETSRFWRVDSTGDTKVFRKRHVQHGLDCAVCILLDRSGSMDGEPMSIAAAATSAFVLAMQRLNGIKTRVVAFPALGGVIQPLLDFGQPIRSAEREIRAIEAFGGTPLVPAMMIEQQILAAQKNLRRMMIVITDGSIGATAGQQVAGIIETCRRQDIEVTAIGIAADVRAHFPVSANINSVHELPQALVSLFEENVLDPVGA